MDMYEGGVIGWMNVWVDDIWMCGLIDGYIYRPMFDG